MNISTRITMDQYDEMIRRGDFEPPEEHHVELIYGEISPMSPIGPPHNDTVREVTEWCYQALPGDVVSIFVQGAIGIPALDSEPQPDVVLTRRQNYRVNHPRPADVLLVIEVADSGLPKDRGLKAKLYAEAGIADYWIVNIQDRCVEVLRDPQGTAYRSVAVFKPGEEVRPLSFPDVTLPVSRLSPD